MQDLLSHPEPHLHFKPRPARKRLEMANEELKIPPIGDDCTCSCHDEAWGLCESCCHGRTSATALRDDQLRANQISQLEAEIRSLEGQLIFALRVAAWHQ